jgi:thiol-disulfide isomerase/thioredoxin
MDLQSLYNNFNKRSECQERFRKMYEAHPDSAFCVYLYARTLIGPQVDTLFREAYRADSNFYWADFALASRVYSFPPYDTTRAIQLYERCIELDNAYPAPFQAIAKLYLAQEKYDKAMQFADLFATASLNPLTPLLLQEQIWEAQGKYDAAEKLLQSYAAENPNEVSVRQALEKLYEKKKDYDGALKQEYEVAKLSNPRVEAFVKIAELYSRAGDADSAITYILIAARQGFNDYRRIQSEDVFKDLRSDKRYDDMISLLKDQSEKYTGARLASFADKADSLKKAVLADTVYMQLPTDVSLATLSGVPVSLDSLRGEPVVMLFWSSWSNQSAGALAMLREFSQLKPSGVQILAVNMWDDDPADAEQFLHDRGYKYDLIPVSSFDAERLGVYGVPTILVIDANGIVRYRDEGYRPSLDQVILWQVNSLT